jgi:hypothetical protein
MHLLAEADARSDGTAALGHSVDLGLLHVKTGKGRDTAEKVRSEQDALSADTHQ